MNKIPDSGEAIASSIYSLYHNWLDSFMFIVSKIRIYFGDIYPDVQSGRHGVVLLNIYIFILSNIDMFMFIDLLISMKVSHT